MKKIVLFALCWTLCIHSTEQSLEHATNNNEMEQIRTGNFSVAISQQIFPLFSFGQNTVRKRDFLAYISGDYIDGCRQHFGTLAPGFLYGINDRTSLFVTIPVATHFKIDNYCSSGIQDITADLEYEFYDRETETSDTSISGLFSLSLPTGSLTKEPPTGAGAPAVFLAAIARYVDTHWYAFTSYGAELNPCRDGSKIGNKFLYQFGVGHTLYTRPGLVVDWLIELDGEFAKKDILHAELEENSGGNVITLGPSLFVSSERITLQAGLATYVLQNLNGTQHKNSVILAFNVRWKFNG